MGFPYYIFNSAVPQSRVIIIDGQSNAEGVSYVDDLIELYNYTNTDVKIWADGEWQSLTPGVNLWGYATNSANPPVISTDRFGVEVSMAHLLKASKNNYYIIKVGRGSTGLAYDETEVDFSENSTNEKHDDLVSTSNAALTALSAVDPNYKIVAYVFIQGEQDALSEDKANDYATNLNNKFNAVESEFTGHNINFIIPKIPSWSARTYKNTIRAAQDSVEASRDDVVVISTDSLTHLDDNIHYDDQGYYDLGILIYNEI